MSLAETAAAAAADPEEGARARARRIEAWARWTLPVAVLVLVILGWHLFVTLNRIPHYILPGPVRVAEVIVADWPVLWDGMLVTAKIALYALALAVLGGGGLAVLFSLSRWTEMSFFPYAVILQVTPVVAIAPLIKIAVDDAFTSALVCAWIVAFFPILSNTTMGLKSADHNLRDLYRIYGATRWQRLRYLELPSALPYFLTGLRIGGGLSLIGAVVAEFVIGTAGTGLGLASMIQEASYRLNIPRMFAALALIALLGVAIFMALTLLSHLLLRRWHESAVRREA
ncbi:MAG: ABC transporter permease [Alphaproteobacteria bacterium]|nr:MAG: ABC transporter permease [Alphaproteobacteria bacterium]